MHRIISFSRSHTFCMTFTLLCYSPSLMIDHVMCFTFNSKLIAPCGICMCNEYNNNPVLVFDYVGLKPLAIELKVKRLKQKGKWANMVIQLVICFVEEGGEKLGRISSVGDRIAILSEFQSRSDSLKNQKFFV